MTDQQAADLIIGLLQNVQKVLAMLAPTSQLHGLTPVMENLIEKLKGPGGGIKAC